MNRQSPCPTIQYFPEIVKINLPTNIISKNFDVVIGFPCKFELIQYLVLKYKKNYTKS